MENNSFNQLLEDFENKFEDLSGNFEIYLTKNQGKKQEKEID